MKEGESRSLLNVFVYWAGKSVSALLFNVLWRREIQGAENVPVRGGALIASNHLSNLDPPLVGSSLPRPIHYFAKEELFEIPVFGWMIRRMNAFPVKRLEHDIGAFKKAHALLASGEVVLLFPEGHRSKTGELGAARAGVGMLACKAGVPVIPVCVSNTDKASRFKKIRIRFGKPLWPKEGLRQKEKYLAFAEEVMAAIADLKSKMYNDFSQ